MSEEVSIKMNLSLVCSLFFIGFSHADASFSSSNASFIGISDNPRLNDHLKLNRPDDLQFTEPFYFVVGADTQFGLICRYIEKKEPNIWDKEIELFDKCIQKINKLEPKPKFFVIVGDMCDAQPTGTKDYELRRRQEKDFFNVLGKLDQEIRFISVPGNHDVGDKPSHVTMNRYRNSFGSEYFAYLGGGYYFIVLNSQYYVDSTLVSSMAHDQDEWLDEQLNIVTRQKTPTIVFMHTPPFISTIDETDSTYFSLNPTTRRVLMDKMRKAGVKAIFCGHLHKNAGGMWHNLEVVTTTAIGGQLGTDNSGIRIVKVYKDKIEHEFHELDDNLTTVTFTEEPKDPNKKS